MILDKADRAAGDLDDEALDGGTSPSEVLGQDLEAIHVSADGRRLRIRAHHRAAPDLEQLARAFIELAEEQLRETSLNPVRVDRTRVRLDNESMNQYSDANTDVTAMTWPEVEAYASKHGFGILDEHTALQGWTRQWVDPRSLRDMHGEFRDAPLHKEARFDALLERNRPVIEAGTFPFSEDVKRTWDDKPAILVERDPGTGEMYVADGELRTLNACYVDAPLIEALVVDLDQGRGAVELTTS